MLRHLAKTMMCRVQLSRHEHNMGVVSTFEELLTHVDTEYFALCDQDDVWLPDKLERSVRLLESSGADLVYTDLRVVDKNLKEVAPSMWRLSNIIPVSGHPVIPLLLKNSVTGCTVVARRRLLERVLPFPENIPMHDWWLALVAACDKGVQPLNEQTVLYRQHEDNAIGASEFGVKGLRARLGRRHVSVSSYLHERLSARLVLIDALQERHLTYLPFLSWFYCQSSLVRFLLNPAYLVYTATHAGVLGFRNLAADWTLTCVPAV